MPNNTTYYVSPFGDDNLPGTLTEPWKTISKANSVLTAGDTVLIRSGEYQEIISPANGGIAGNPITYKSYPGEIALVVGSGPDKPGVVCIGWVAEAGWDNAIPISQRTLMNKTSCGYVDNPKSYITIDGLHISYKWSNDPTCVNIWGDPFYKPEGRFGYVHIDNYDSVGIVIKNCKIYQSGNPFDNYVGNFRQTGIMYGGFGATFENNDISGMWLGIWMFNRAPRNVIIRNNNIHDIGSNCIDVGSPGSKTLQATLIEKNILGPTINEDGIQFEPWYDTNQIPYDQSSNRGVVIRNNIFKYCAENSIDLKGAGYVLIEDNIAYGSPGQDDGGVKQDFRTGEYVTGSATYAQWKDENGNWVIETAENRGGGQGFVALGAGNMAENIIIRNNVAYDNFATMQIYQKFKIYNNTFVNNNRDYTGPNSIWSPTTVGFLGMLGYGNEPPMGTVVGAVVKNNIFTEHNHGEIAVNVYGFGNNLDIDYNLYCNHDSDLMMRDPGGGMWSWYSFNDWKNRLNSSNVLGKEEHSILTDTVRFVSVPIKPVGEIDIFDFNIQADSPAYKTGTAITKTTQAGNGMVIPLDDAEVFSSGYGIVAGDSVLIGSNSPVNILSIPTNKSIMVDRSIIWNSGEPVMLTKLGIKPNIGATVSTVSPPEPPVPPDEPDSGSQENIIKNSDFSNGLDDWFFYADNPYTTIDTSDGIAVISISGIGSNTQLSQRDLSFTNEKLYTISFKARSIPARTVAVYLHKDVSPYTSFGLSDEFNLTMEWQTYTRTFQASETGTDARLRFWMSPWGQAGDEYYFDDVVIEEYIPIPIPEPIPPSILIQPKDVTVTEGEPATFFVSASGTELLYYQWKINGTDVATWSLPAFTIQTASLSMNSNWIQCAVSNVTGSVLSDAAVLTVKEKLPSYTFVTELINEPWKPYKGMILTYIGFKNYNNGKIEVRYFKPIDGTLETQPYQFVSEAIPANNVWTPPKNAMVGYVSGVSSTGKITIRYFKPMEA